jgi:hypothetical protein
MPDIEPFGLGGQDNTIVRCMTCGFALKQEELGCQITGMCVDFTKRVMKNTSFTFCISCTEKITQYCNEDDEICLARRESLHEHL